MNNVRLAALMSALEIAPCASAGLVTLSMVNGDGGGMPFNTVAFNIGNISDPGVAITSWTMTVGDTAFLYDFLYLSKEVFSGGDGTQVVLLTQGEHDNDNNIGPDAFAYSFTNFTPGVAFAGQWDIDIDTGSFDVDARAVLFNNGDAPNAVATFTFSDGSSFSYTFPDLPIQDSYTLTIPSPGAAALFGAAGVLALHRRRTSGR